MRQLLRLAHCFLLINKDRPGRLCTHNDILCDRKRRNQHKVLMNHSDSVVDRLHRALIIDLFAFVINLTGCLLFNCKNNFHQSGLTGTILADDRMYLTLSQFDIDVAVRHCAVRINFGNILQL